MYKNHSFNPRKSDKRIPISKLSYLIAALFGTVALSHAQAAGFKKNGLLVGVGVEYWRNKFCNYPAKNPPGTTKETTAMLLADYHF